MCSTGHRPFGAAAQKGEEAEEAEEAEGRKKGSQASAWKWNIKNNAMCMMSKKNMSQNQMFWPCAFTILWLGRSYFSLVVSYVVESSYMEKLQRRDGIRTQNLRVKY